MTNDGDRERDGWQPAEYQRFEALREQPAYDLMELIEPRPGMRIVDLGCGSGKLTAALHRRLNARETVGVERSAAMLVEARGHAGDGLRFQRGDIARFTADAPFDLVFASASLQWVPDHRALLPRLTRLLAAGGQLAVQVPANHDHASHVVAAELAGEEPYARELGGYVRTSPVLAPETYAELLYALGYRRQHVRLQVYPLELAAADEVVEWVKGSLLSDYRERLPEHLFDRFLAAYRGRLLARLDHARPYFYAYKRLLFWGARE
jgi:trans-aconitate 2-methyltransferase